MIKIEDEHLILPNGQRIRLLRIKGVSRVRKMKEYKKTGKFGFYVYVRYPEKGDAPDDREYGGTARFMFRSEFEAFTSRALLYNIWIERLRKRTRKRTY